MFEMHVEKPTNAGTKLVNRANSSALNCQGLNASFMYCDARFTSMASGS
jgi:hypothetical protein